MNRDLQNDLKNPRRPDAGDEILDQLVLDLRALPEPVDTRETLDLEYVRELAEGSQDVLQTLQEERAPHDAFAAAAEAALGPALPLRARLKVLWECLRADWGSSACEVSGLDFVTYGATWRKLPWQQRLRRTLGTARWAIAGDAP